MIGVSFSVGTRNLVRASDLAFEGIVLETGFGTSVHHSGRICIDAGD